MSVDSKLLTYLHCLIWFFSLIKERGRCLHSLRVNIGVTLHWPISFSGSELNKPPNHLLHIIAFVLPGLGYFLLSQLLYRAT